MVYECIFSPRDSSSPVFLYRCEPGDEKCFVQPLSRTCRTVYNECIALYLAETHIILLQELDEYLASTIFLHSTFNKLLLLTRRGVVVNVNILPLLLRRLHLKDQETSFYEVSGKDRFDIEAEGVINNAGESWKSWLRQNLITRVWISRPGEEEELNIRILISRQRLVEQGELLRLCEELLGEVDFHEVLGLIDEAIPRKLGGGDLQFTEVCWDDAT
jgi:hypothetical protein